MPFQILTEQDLGSQLAYLKVIFKSGSLADPRGAPGTAFFTARALLRGTRRRSCSELTQMIERLGGTISVSMEATQTVFDCAVLAENLDAFLELLREILTEPKFDAAECAILKKTIRGELQSALEDPQVLAARGVMRALYEGSRLEDPASGTLAGIESLSCESAREFFNQSYVRSNLLIGVTSRESGKTIKSKIQAKLGALRDGKSCSHSCSFPSL